MKPAITYKNPEQLTANPQNARIHSDNQITKLVASIKEYGFTSPILIDESNMILAGHGRNIASLKLGLDSVPCIIIDSFSSEAKEAYTIADNALAELSTWDSTLLQSELDFIGAGELLTDLKALDNLPPLENLTSKDFGDMTKEPAPVQNKITNKPINVICPYCKKDNFVK